MAVRIPASNNKPGIPYIFIIPAPWRITGACWLNKTKASVQGETQPQRNGQGMMKDTNAPSGLCACTSMYSTWA